MLRLLVTALALSGCATFGVPRCPDHPPARVSTPSPLAARVARARLGRVALQPSVPVEPPRQLGFSRDGRFLLSAGDDVHAVRWDVHAMREESSIAPPEGGIMRFFLAVQADYGFVALRDGTAAALYDMTGKRIHHLDGHRGASEYTEPVDSAAFSPNGKWIATGDDVGTLRIWSLSDGKMRGALKLGSDRLSALAFSPDSRLVAAATSTDRGVRLVNIATREVIGSLPTPTNELYHVDFSRDGTRLVAADFTSKVVVWELDACARIDLDRPEGFATDIKLSPDGTVVAASISDGLVLWDARTGAKLTDIRVPVPFAHSSFRSLAFSPDSHTLALGTDTGVALVRLD